MRLDYQYVQVHRTCARSAHRHLLCIAQELLPASMRSILACLESGLVCLNIRQYSSWGICAPGGTVRLLLHSLMHMWGRRRSMQ